MENQHPAPFPFDAMDGALGGADDLGVPDLFPIVASTPPHAQSGTLQEVRRNLEELQAQLRTLIGMIDREIGGTASPRAVSDVSRLPSSFSYEVPRPPMSHQRPVDPLPSGLQHEDEDALRVIEGVFDGQNMVGPDGKQYSVPANYASKSKLVEGDILKLRITSRGAFVYKQIGPIARDRRIGALERDDVTGEFVVLVPDTEGDLSSLTRAVAEHGDLPPVPFKRYRTLRASVSFYRGAPGDEVVILVPKDTPSTWAAVENVIKR
ncbi:hypothetical protein HY632_02195 [Candidatus Uhrbacteria bacterium]|nr:hypothetical protein [Candidatus Uhrbacteria bacterium]